MEVIKRQLPRNGKHVVTESIVRLKHSDESELHWSVQSSNPNPNVGVDVEDVEVEVLLDVVEDVAEVVAIASADASRHARQALQPNVFIATICVSPCTFTSL